MEAHRWVLETNITNNNIEDKSDRAETQSVRVYTLGCLFEDPKSKKILQIIAFKGQITLSTAERTLIVIP